MILGGFSLLCLVSLYSYNPGDPSFTFYLSEATPVLNYGGIIGAFLSDTLIQLLGAVSYGFPLMILIFCFLYIRHGSLSVLLQFVTGSLLFLTGLSVILFISLQVDPLFSPNNAGGLVGRYISEKVMVRYFSVVGAYIVLGSILIASLSLLTRITLSGALRTVSQNLAAIYNRMFHWLVSKLKEDWYDGEEEEPTAPKKRTRKTPSRKETEADLLPFDEEPVEAEEIPEKEPEVPLIGVRGTVPLMDDEPFSELFRAKERIVDFPVEGYIPPPLSFLNDPPEIPEGQKEEELIKKSNTLTRKLADFGVEGKIVQVLPGPIVTLYEFEPAPGVKVSRIVNLADDLALGMRAPSIRILAPVPGKAVVGIEIPNSVREFVFLKQVLGSDEFQRNRSPLNLSLGRDSLGNPVVADLAQIPHLLIAGATGSGKSVGVNSMIVSILFNASPQEVNFIMIDPKMLELSVYDGIPHLISPVIVNPKKAANALRWAVTEMERRYKVMAEKGVRNIASYNRVVKESRDANGGTRKMGPELDGEPGREPESPMPYIVIVIDELADLMLVSSKDVEDSLTRIAQMARAAGIHLLVATQRPSVDVLTGIIKANFPARISFQVTSRVDSRTILDMIGAERLLGKGDMLFLPPGTSHLQRIHGAFISDEEIKRVVDFLREQKQPVYQEEILEAPEPDENIEDDLQDEFYRQAVDLVAKTRQASISMIQRRLRIGYNRAARIVELMDLQGLVGPADGSKPREVFVRDSGNADPF